MFRESKTRSTTKTISWRIIAFLTSWFVLMAGLSDIPLWNAIIMNVTGMVMFYFHERIWNRIDIGKHSQ